MPLFQYSIITMYILIISLLLSSSGFTDRLCLHVKKMNCKSSISVLLAALIPYMFLVFDASQAAVPMDTLLPGQSISGSELLVSENGVFG